jgi:potassium-dependent mechanosensitive channel
MCEETKMRSKTLFIILSLVLMCSSLMVGPSVTIAQTPENTETEAQSAVNKPAVPELQDIVPLAANLGKRLDKLNGQFAKLQTTDQVEENLAPILEGLEKLTERLAQVEKAATQDFGQLRGLKSGIQFEEMQIKRIITQITDGIDIIEDAIDEWRLEQQKWAYWREALSQNNLYGYVKPTFVSVEDMFRDAQRIIEKHLKPILAIQQKTWQAQNRILDLKQRVDSMIVAIRGDVLGSATPFLFSSRFLAQLNRDLFEEFGKSIQAIQPLRKSQYLAQMGWVLLLPIIFVATLATVLRRRPDLLKGSERLKWFVNRPVATGCLIGLPLFTDVFDPTIFLRLLLMLVIVLAAGRLLGGLVRETWLKRSIYALLVISILLEIFDVFNLPAPLLRLFIAVVTLSGLMYLGRRAFARGKGARPHIWFLRLCVGVLAFSFVAEVFGFSLLAEYLLTSSLLTLFQLVLAYMLLQFLQGMIEVLVRSRHLQKFALIKNNTRDILAKTDLVCVLATGLILLVVVLRTWKVYADIGTALTDILSLGLTIGERHFSIGLMLAAGVVLYGAFLFSWSIQSLMLDGVILSRKMQQGVRISMARLVHYAVILVGFVVTLSVLGFDFTNIAIIGGAVGVGIGFGMQTIVNNFVCGLIMLFERPVKVGDAVEFGNQQGRVKQVGLRATVVETYDHAEIVVPNADLITSQVTNWTLAERQRRLKLPVGVAYGSDVTLVMQTLMECADDHVMVLSNPKPAVIFFGFGDSSLDFELRVWISDFDQRRQVQTEINQDIDQRFRDLNIEIPFPQRDLHLRSVDSSVSGVIPSPNAS